MHFGAFKGFGSRREAALIREKTEAVGYAVGELETIRRKPNLKRHELHKSVRRLVESVGSERSRIVTNTDRHGTSERRSRRRILMNYGKAIRSRLSAMRRNGTKAIGGEGKARCESHFID